MISIERIVRPYAPATALAFGRVISRTVAPSDAVASIAWGDLGALPTPTQEDIPDDDVGFNVTVCDTDYQETNRVVQPVRIKNPDDETQSVVIDRIQSMSFRVNDKGKNAGAIRSQTTSFGDIGFGGSLENVPKADNCKASFNLAGT